MEADSLVAFVEIQDKNVPKWSFLYVYGYFNFKVIKVWVCCQSWGNLFIDEPFGDD